MHVMLSDVPLLLKRMEKQGQQKRTYICIYNSGCLDFDSQ